MNKGEQKVLSQLTLFLTALQFYTRIPMPKGFEFRKEALVGCNRYFPLVGSVVAGVSSSVFGLLLPWLPQGIAVFAAVGAGILLTGAFHEDGLADFCDGFGGGWEKDTILTIMKDSRLGTFGAIGMFLVVGLKMSTLVYMPEALVIPSLFIGHSLSRLLALSFMAVMPYARKEGKAKSVSTNMSRFDLSLALIFGIFPFAGFVAFSDFFVGEHANLSMFVGALFLVLLGLHLYLRRLMIRWIEGYTGDCLGAAQQLGEVLILTLILGFFGTN